MIEHTKIKYLVELLNGYYNTYHNDTDRKNNSILEKSFDLISKRPKALVLTYYRDIARKVVEI